MKLWPSFLLVLILFNISFITIAEERPYDELKYANTYVYKTIDGFDLKLNVIYPNKYEKGKKYGAIIFFFGGGWKGGDVHQFEQHCQYLASKGMIAIAANYRVASRNNSTPFDAVEDAKSAIIWLKQNSKELGIKKNKIVAAGGSAGGHLAASTAIIPGFEEAGKKGINAKPSALVLFNPVINTMPEGYGSERLGDRAELISPAHHVIPKLPPTLIFHGTKDKTVPYENIEDFQARMEVEGNTCYVVSFKDQGHGFFNYGRNENKYYDLTIEKTEAFLRGLNIIK